jgi:hypothetical protein
MFLNSNLKIVEEYFKGITLFQREPICKGGDESNFPASRGRH